MPTLKLSTPSPHAARDLILAAAAARVKLDLTTGAPSVVLTAATGEQITEPNTAARHIASLAADGGVSLLGSTPEEQAVVRLILGAERGAKCVTRGRNRRP